MNNRLLEKTLLEHNFMEVYCSLHPVAALRQGLTKAGAITAASLSRLPSGKRVIISGLVIFFHTPPTRSGKRIIFATLEDESGLFDAVIMPNVQERWGKTIYTSEILTLEGKLIRQGKKGISISIKVTRILPEVSGRIDEVHKSLGVLLY